MQLQQALSGSEPRGGTFNRVVFAQPFRREA